MALLSAQEAADLLGVKRATLYTYVSRGQLDRVTVEGVRGSRYRRTQVERLKYRHDARAGHEAAAAEAMRWGQPIVDSAITRIEAGALSYRGRPLMDCVGSSFESIAELLWTGEVGAGHWPPSEGSADTHAGPIEGLQRAILGHVEPTDGGALRGARHLVSQLVGSITGAADGPIAQRLAVAWQRPDAQQAIDLALVLCADHELNASTFAARVVASTGAALAACLVAALSALSGPKHGGLTEEIERMADAWHPGQDVGQLMANGRLPGFGHPLYPQGDPRARLLCEAAWAKTERPGSTVMQAISTAAKTWGLPPPTLDFGLVSLTRAYGLPRGSALSLFAVGRSAGWIAHALEQRATGRLLRPRARYVGP